MHWEDLQARRAHFVQTPRQKSNLRRCHRVCGTGQRQKYGLVNDENSRKGPFPVSALVALRYAPHKSLLLITLVACAFGTDNRNFWTPRPHHDWVDEPSAGSNFSRVKS